MTETKKVCPQCNTVHSPSANVCRNCGYRFSSQIMSNEYLPNQIVSVEERTSTLLQLNQEDKTENNEIEEAKKLIVSNDWLKV